VVGVLCLEQKTESNLESSWLHSLDDILCCPFEQLDLAFRLKRLLPRREGVGETLEVWQAPNAFREEGLVGESKIFLEALEKIPKLASSEAAVLIYGETGTGKELFARAIHYHSPRKRKPFVPVNCGALPDHLFENELFGHTKGAFTDACIEQEGLIREAEGGTVFLDEVDALSSAAQIKLLRFLQDHEYRPLGSPKTLTANVRVLAATNRDVKCLIQEGTLREDLYYRLNVLSLFIPPLRDRPDDIPVLSKYFLRRAAKVAARELPQLEGSAMLKLQNYAWPGNVRELESVIQRVVTFNTTQTVKPEDIDLPTPNESQGEAECSFQQGKTRVVENFERVYLINLLTEHNGNISQAARASGKERRAFKRLLSKHHLDRRVFLANT
jgi:DNA-binding NtrC family response regulator